jgi:hypothetical protein
MLGLDVALGTAPSPSPGPPISFAIANHDPALFEIGSAAFQILDATFAWEDLAVTLTTAPGSCVRASCP